MALTLWHNPRCSKSRAAKALLEARGLDVELRLYLKEPPSAEEVTALATRIGKPLIEVLRRSEPPFKTLHLKEADAETLAQAVAAHPILLERPILDTGTRAIIGRPPEAIETLL